MVSAMRTPARSRTEKNAMLVRNCINILGNGQKRELPVLFGQKRMYPENNTGRKCCWPYMIGQLPLSPVFGQKRPGTPGNSYFAQLPPVSGHFMSLSGGLLDCPNRSTWATRTINSKISNFDQVTWRLTTFPHFSVTFSGLIPLPVWGIHRSFITPARTTTYK